jgi:Coenzyme PQQ synthesis protein D (PqqD)
MSNVDSRFEIMKDIHERTFDGDLVLLDLARGDYFGVNEIGARLWQGLSAGKTPREIAAEIQPDYEVSSETLLADLERLTTELVTRGLIRGR